MNTKAIYAFLIGIAAVVALAAGLYLRNRPATAQALPAEARLPSKPVEPVPGPINPQPAPVARTIPPHENLGIDTSTGAGESVVATNKLQRLDQIREAFRRLAAGDPATAMRAARQLTDDTERETALLTLVTEWTGGELSPPQQRAQFIAMLGLEAGLGMELVKNPELAVLWANELTEGPGRSAILLRAAVTLADSDPATALALSAQVPEKERAQFVDSVYAGWAANDTAAALQWTGQIADPAEREAALQAIREVAPVGIGAELRAQDGYPVINRVLSGTPAELSGQLQPGDRIVALAQAGKEFVDARNLPLAEVVQMIRGAPGTALQLQVLPANAPPNTQPRTVFIVRDQIKYKR